MDRQVAGFSVLRELQQLIGRASPCQLEPKGRVKRKARLPLPTVPSLGA